MPKKMKNAPPRSRWDSEVRLLAWLATCVSVFSFLFYFQRGDPIRPDDKQVTFVTKLGPLEVRAKFILKEMLYQGKLAL